MGRIARGALGLNVVLVVAGAAASCSTEAPNREVAQAPDAAAPRAAAIEESAAARSRVSEIRSRFALPAPALVRFESSGEARVRATLPEEAKRAVRHAATVQLPARANGSTVLTDDDSGVQVAFALQGAADAPLAVADGHALYARALRGADVVHRIGAAGTEDVVVFAERPAAPELRYVVDVSRVAGLRLANNTLEMLDASGAPRLRVLPPFVIDAAGKRQPAQLALEGCATDGNLAGPWGRPVVAPGASSCGLTVTWSAGVSYPAIVDPVWGATGIMACARAEHTATLLQNGNVLVVGGGQSSACTTGAELYNPGTATFSATTGAFVYPLLLGHTATLMPVNGTVLVAGGLNNINPGAAYKAEGYVYDPSTGKFSTSKAMISARGNAAATWMPSYASNGGGVLITGGMNSSVAAYATAEVYSVASGAFAATSVNMTTPRVYHAAATIPGSSGGYTYLVMGGQNATGTTLASAETFAFNAVNTQFFTATGNMTTARSNFAVALLPSLFKLLVTGGGTATAELFNSATQTFAATGSMPAARAYHTATTLTDGTVLVAGGENALSELITAAVYSPTTGTFAATTSMAVSRGSHTATLLGTGQVLVAGGYTTTVGASTNTAELYKLRANGAACAANGDCVSGFCVSGMCCNTACTGACNVCSKANGGNADGTCGPALEGKWPGNPSCSPYLCDGTATTSCPTSCSSDLDCIATDYCAPNGTCQPQKAQGATCNQAAGADCKVAGCRDCASGHCVDGYCCNADCSGNQCQYCNIAGSAGTCTNAAEGSAPRTGCSGGAYVCNGASANCPAACASDLDCGSNYYCNSLGVCTARIATGQTCNSAAGADCKVAGCRDCISGNCVDGYCCNSACSGGCQSCNQTGNLGSCTTVPAKDPGRNGSCAPYVCNGTSNSCPTTCSSDADCASADYCAANGTCTARKAQGSTCNDAAGADCKGTGCRVCATGVGQCVDGYCCNTTCANSCDYCNLPGNLGTCTVAPANDPGNPLCVGTKCNGVNTTCNSTCAADTDCASGYYCDNNQKCQPVKAVGSTCNPASECISPSCRECGTNPCVDGFCCNSACSGACDRCDLTGSQGTCTVVAANSAGSPACTPYKCDGQSATCPTTCSKNSDCTANEYCAPSGKCTPTVAPGGACTSGAACGTGFCVDGVCCDIKCDGQCQACDVPGSVGVCTAVKGAPHGQRTACDGAGTTCGGTCDGAKVDTCTYPQSNTSCGSECSNGLVTPSACDGHGKCQTGQQQSCPDNLQCADDKTCKTSCQTDADCTSGVCTNNACAPKQVVNQATQNNSGCAASPASSGGFGEAFAVLALAALGLTRRRRS